MENKEEAEQFLKERCTDNGDYKDQTCLAAKEAIKNLKEIQERESLIKEVFEPPEEDNTIIEEEPKKELSTEDYKVILKKYPDKINQIMENKCKKLFSNPKYFKTPSLQDKECNAAKELIEEEKSKKKKQHTKNPEIKNLEYFKNNIIEAEKTIANCQTEKIDKVICQYASVALREHNDETQKKESLEEYFKGNLLAARDTITKCQNEVETNHIKCETAFKVYNDNVSKTRSKREFEKHLNHYRGNLDEAKKLLKTKCKSFTPKSNKSIFIENDECSAVKEALDEQKVKNDKIELLKILRKYKDRFTQNVADSRTFNAKKYQSLIDHFSKDHKLTEDFVVSCIENKTRAKVSALDCLASLNVITELLESAQKLEEEREKAKKEYKNYYRKFFADNPNKALELLSGRCKLVFENQWYEYDENIKDEECEAARAEQKKLNRIKRQKEIENLNALKKSDKYYIDNIESTKEIEEECRNGIINNLHDCEMSIKVLQKLKEDKMKAEKYKQHYKEHILEAKYKLKWCKSNLVKFDTHCQVVKNILKNHKDREFNKEKYNKELEFFRSNPLEANIIYIYHCKEKISNNWYFLDINMQTEECNAAYEIVNDL